VNCLYCGRELNDWPMNQLWLVKEPFEWNGEMYQVLCIASVLLRRGTNHVPGSRFNLLRSLTEIVCS
jgi:hypothetical protein